MPDTPLRVGEVERGPVVVAERTPHRVVIIGRDRVSDPHVLDGLPDIADIVLEGELGRVDADHRLWHKDRE